MIKRKRFDHWFDECDTINNSNIYLTHRERMRSKRGNKKSDHNNIYAHNFNIIQTFGHSQKSGVWPSMIRIKILWFLPRCCVFMSLSLANRFNSSVYISWPSISHVNKSNAQHIPKHKVQDTEKQTNEFRHIAIYCNC